MTILIAKSEIEEQKIEIKATSKIGSLDNVKHRPGGGDKRIFDDKEYLKQMGSKPGSEGPSGTQGEESASTDESRISSRRTSRSRERRPLSQTSVRREDRSPHQTGHHVSRSRNNEINDLNLNETNNNGIGSTRKADDAGVEEEEVKDSTINNECVEHDSSSNNTEGNADCEEEKKETPLDQNGDIEAVVGKDETVSDVENPPLDDDKNTVIEEIQKSTEHKEMSNATIKGEESTINGKETPIEEKPLEEEVPVTKDEQSVQESEEEKLEDVDTGSEKLGEKSEEGKLEANKCKEENEKLGEKSEEGKLEANKCEEENEKLGEKSEEGKLEANKCKEENEKLGVKSEEGKLEANKCKEENEKLGEKSEEEKLEANKCKEENEKLGEKSEEGKLEANKCKEENVDVLDKKVNGDEKKDSQVSNIKEVENITQHEVEKKTSSSNEEMQLKDVIVENETDRSISDQLVSEDLGVTEINKQVSSEKDGKEKIKIEEKGELENNLPSDLPDIEPQLKKEEKQDQQCIEQAKSCSKENGIPSKVIGKSDVAEIEPENVQQTEVTKEEATKTKEELNEFEIKEVDCKEIKNTNEQSESSKVDEKKSEDKRTVSDTGNDTVDSDKQSESSQKGESIDENKLTDLHKTEITKQVTDLNRSESDKTNITEKPTHFDTNMIKTLEIGSNQDINALKTINKPIHVEEEKTSNNREELKSKIDEGICNQTSSMSHESKEEESKEDSQMEIQANIKSNELKNNVPVDEKNNQNESSCDKSDSKAQGAKIITNGDIGASSETKINE